MCPHKYFLNYVLGIKEASGHAANKGNITHKALELLARYKLATQNKAETFADDELGTFKVADIEPEYCISVAWEHITKNNPHNPWSEKDFDDCRRWMYEALTWKGGMFSPLAREVVQPEQYFDLEIDEPWAGYDYILPDGQKVSGKLRIKGTMDLMVRNGKDYEMIDWKTGRRIDWSNFQYKSYEKLIKDFQLRLYHYAATRLWPDIENIFVTIFFTQDGGPESMCFTKEDIHETKKMLEKYFTIIRNIVKPKRVYPSKKCSFCDYAKKDLKGNKVTSYEDSICNAIYGDVIQLGMDKVMTKYGKPDAFLNYGSGGGRTDRDIKQKEKDENSIQEASTGSQSTETSNQEG